jgi:hypothetical protein
MQPMTVQSDLCLPSSHTTAGDFGSPEPWNSSSGKTSVAPGRREPQIAKGPVGRGIWPR